MKKNIKRIMIFASLIIVMSLILFTKNILSVKKDKDVINVKELSTEFMDNYFAEYSKLDELDNKENILIVTSMNEIKDTYGAVKVIEAPNNQYFLQYNDTASKDSALEKLENDSSLISVDENAIHHLSGESSYNSWGIDAMHLNTAIEDSNNLDLNEVVVAIIDSGCDVSLFEENFPGRIAGTYNARTNGSNVTDYSAHGTHISGTIAEGTRSNVKIFPIKVTSLGYIFATDVITAVNYVVSNDTADVINMSFGSQSYVDAEYIAIEAATQENIIVLAAAGNESTSEEEYPAAFDNTIAISAVDSNLNLSSFSNYGSYITFAAPGENIESINGNMSGTSMATPHAAAAVAILKGINNYLSLDQTIDILENYAQDLGATGWDMYYGYGFISFENFDFNDFTIVKEGDTAAELTGIEIAEQMPAEVNYLNETNFMNFKIKFNYNNMYYYTKYIWEIADDVEILNYDPLSTDAQEVTIRYDGLETTFTYVNAEIRGWNYYVVDDDKAIISEVLSNKITPSDVKSVESYDNSHKIFGEGSANSDRISLPQRAYVPDHIDGYEVVGIDSNVFSYNFDAVFLPETVVELKSSAFENSTVRKVISSADGIAVGANTFKNAYTLETFTGKITSISSSAFYNCYAIDNIELDDSITTIYDSTFYNCKNMENVNIPESVQSIYADAFNNTKIKDLHIPKSTTFISSTAFINSRALETISVDSENTSYDSRENSNVLINTYSNSIILGSGNATVPDTVVRIESSAFVNNKKLENLVIPSNVTEIQERAFYGCDNIKQINLDTSVTSFDVTSFNKVRQGIIYIEGSYDISVATKLKLGQNNYKFLVPYSVLVNCPLWYSAYDKVGDLIITLNYRGDFENIEESLTESITSNYEVSYQKGTDSFRYGDTYFTVTTTSQYDIPIEKQVTVIIRKATPEYTVPTGLTAIARQTLSEIELPEGFEWMNPDEVITGEGNKIYLAKFTPEDTENYEIVENIEVTLSVTNPYKRTISFNANGGTGTMDDIATEEGYEEEIPDISFTNGEYWASTWNTEPDGTGTKYKAGQVITIEDNLNLYAIWQEPITGIELDKDYITVEEDKTVTITVTLAPSTATDVPITWESLDTSIATVKDGVITGVNEGTTTITATTENNLTASVRVKVTYQLPFKDVSRNSWYYETVKYSYKNKIILGYNNTTFGPNDNITRGQLVTILWRLEGEPDASSLTNKFSDVGSDYYTQAVKWASNNKIVNGYGGTTKFGPNDPIIRQDLAVILNNYAKYKELEATSNTDLSGFSDYNLVKGGYAEPAMKWAVGNKVVNGSIYYEKKLLNPVNNATRAEAAAMIMNFIKQFELL